MGAIMTRVYLVAIALCLCGTARASTTTAALEILCGPGHEDLAPMVDAAARRYMQHPVLLVSIMARESGCRMDVVGAHGEVCAMQLRGAARNGHSRRALQRDPALCIDTGARWLALRMVDCAGLGVLSIGGYNARECRHGKRYARKVLATVARVWREMRRQQEGRS